jgi:CheY-like chemotaxis protein/two-component sensor histidine kinase
VKRKPRKKKISQKKIAASARLAQLGLMTASLAHEVNNPLAAVLGCAENIEIILDNPNFDREQVRLQVLEILRSAERASQIVNSMKKLGYREQMEMSVIDVAELAFQAADHMRQQLGEIEAQFQFDFSHPVPIQCDPQQVEQILVNILKNALYALAGETESKMVKVSFANDSRYHYVKIWNNGPVIPRAIQKKLMTPFFTTKPSGDGTGLGLSICRAIMESHHGHLSFSSCAKDGTEFVLAFPRLKTEPWTRPHRKESGRILIIDRLLHSREILAAKFKPLGFEVELAESVPQALQTLKKPLAPSCALFDVVPGSEESLHGLQVLRQTLGPHCPIFTVTAYPSARVQPSDLKSRGATECYEKPLRIENFSQILQWIHRLESAAA